MAKKKKSSRAKSSSKSEDESVSRTRIYIAAGVLVILVLILIFYRNIVPKQDNTVAIINGETITQSEFNTLYNRVPDVYKTSGLTPEVFLNENLVPQKLLLQEAGKRGITADDSEVDSMINSIIESSGATEDDFKAQIEKQNLTYDDFKELTKEQIIITKLLNESVPGIDIPDDNVSAFYDENLELFQTGNDTYAEFDEVKDKIRDYLANQKFMDDIKANAQIQIFLDTSDSSGLSAGASAGSSVQSGSGSTGSTFTDTGKEVCTEDGKPIVILFSTTTCPHCRWIMGTFDDFAKEYSDRLAVYHWELDTGDNTLTSEEETEIPDTYANLFWQNSQQGGVPTFVFGCKYSRIGNAFENSNDLDAEAREFRAVADSLLSS